MSTMPQDEMSEGVVIPFPGRRLPPPAGLSRSFAELHQALQEQSAAIAKWRAALVDLQSAMTALGETFATCSKNLKASARY